MDAKLNTDHFSAEKIVARCNTWDSKGVMATIVLENAGLTPSGTIHVSTYIENFCTPVVWVIGWKADLGDFEPAGAITRCCGCVADFGHVDLEGRV